MRYGRFLRGIMILGDYIVLNIAYLLALWLTMPDSVFESRWIWLIANISFIPSVILYSNIHLTRIFYADRVALTALKSSAVQVAVWLMLLYIFDIFDVGARSCFLYAVSFYILLSAWWLLSRKALKRLRRMGFNYKRTIVVGGRATGREVIRELQSDDGYGYKLMGVFDENPKKLKGLSSPVKGSVEDVPQFVHDNRIDIIYYTLDAEDEETVRRLMLVAEEESADFVYVPSFHRILSGQFHLSSVGNLPALTHNLTPLNLRRNRMIKRVFDLMVSIPFLIVSPIIFIPVAVAIKMTSKGPVFFKQKRTGFHGKEFVCYKFRTMKVNADSDNVQATKDDPRKTKLGDFLRRSSIDELPQFFNVLIGNMSVVGPRPHMVSHTEEYSVLIEKYMVRHSVKPGITGWAQVNGYRGGTKHLWQMEKRVEYDVWYIRNWNIFLDVKIVFLTMFNALRGEKNAY